MIFFSNLRSQKFLKAVVIRDIDLQYGIPNMSDISGFN